MDCSTEKNAEVSVRPLCRGLDSPDISCPAAFVSVKKKQWNSKKPQKNANALLDQEVPVLMTNFPTILNRLTGIFSEDRTEFISTLSEYDLLIIDDLGVERSTDYAMEQIFFIIDSCYRSRKPMIITTNLKLSELKNPPDLAHARIYDRILERCAPILFDGKNFREENASVTKVGAKEFLSLIEAETNETIYNLP